MKTIIDITLDMILNKKVNNLNNSDPKNLLKFGYIFLFFISYMKNITNTRILYFRNKDNKRLSKTCNIFLSLSSTLSIILLPLVAKAWNRQPIFISSDSKTDH